MRPAALIALAMIALAAMAAPLTAQAQPRRPAAAAPTGPAISASQRVMAGSMLSVIVSRAPPGARLAIARPDSPASSAILVEEIGPRPSVTVPVPGVAEQGRPVDPQLGGEQVHVERLARHESRRCGMESLRGDVPTRDHAMTLAAMRAQTRDLQHCLTMLQTGSYSL